MEENVGFFLLVEIVITGEWRADVIMGAEFLGATCVLGRNNGYLLEDADGPEGHIFQIADWRADNVKGSGHGLLMEDDAGQGWRWYCLSLPLSRRFQSYPPPDSIGK